MTAAEFSKGNLVLYRGRPARVVESGKKLEIAMQAGRTATVRPKDIQLLHPGPVADLAELRPLQGDVRTTWELLEGETTDLHGLADLAFGRYSPSTAWTAWQWVQDGLYFHGVPEMVVCRSAQAVEQQVADRAARAAEEQAWTGFLSRVQAGIVSPADGRYLHEVEESALGQRTGSKALRALGRAESQENAHALLLALGYWDRAVNPYPQRLGMPSCAPDVDLPNLPTEDRVDLSHLAAFAIDDEGTQAPDDALSLEHSAGACWLWVHVADPAAIVPPGSPADLEARGRGASLYLPEGSVPMLPQAVLQTAGLGLEKASPALSFRLALRPDGCVAGVDVVPSWVRVTRMTYEQTDQHIEEEPFQSLFLLAQANQARRLERGAITIDLPEVTVQVDRRVVTIRSLLPLRSRDMVSEAMLMAGEATARYAVDHGLPFPFAAQPPPQRTEVGEGLAGMFTCRRALQPSRYSTVPAPHAGLGLELYSQVTSPLRRYLDLVAHQQLRRHLRREPLLDEQWMVEQVGASAAITGFVRKAERLSRQHWTLVYLLQRPGWRGAAVLVEKTSSRGRFLIPELDLETTLQLRRDIPLNAVVDLTLSRVDLPNLESFWVY